MNAAVKLGGFAIVLLVVFAVGLALGAVVGR